MQTHAIYFDATTTAAGAVLYQSRELPGVEVPPGTQSGAVGVVAFEAGAWCFRPYLDPTLRRRPELDDAQAIGWSNRRQPGGWTAPRGLVPGAAGRFVEDATAPVLLDVPAEFFNLARECRTSAEVLLRGFISDACAIFDNAAEPRADRYHRTSDAATAAAEDYINAAWASEVDLAQVVVYRIPDDEFDYDDDENECAMIQIPTAK